MTAKVNRFFPAVPPVAAPTPTRAHVKTLRKASDADDSVPQMPHMARLDPEANAGTVRVVRPAPLTRLEQETRWLEQERARNG